MKHVCTALTACAFAMAAPSLAADGELTVTAATPPKVVDFTAEGRVDWAHWGRVAGTTILHRKAVPRPLIGEIVKIGPREVHTFETNPTAFTWSDGAPTAEVKATRSGVFIYGQHAGFQVAVPADPTPRLAKFYCGVWRGQGNLEATLSDGSAAMATAAKVGVDPEAGDNVVFTVRYRAASAGQTLTLKWTNAGNQGNVTVQAVTLSDAP